MKKSWSFTNRKAQQLFHYISFCKGLFWVDSMGDDTDKDQQHDSKKLQRKRPFLTLWSTKKP